MPELGHRCLGECSQRGIVGSEQCLEHDFDEIEFFIVRNSSEFCPHDGGADRRR